MRIVGLSEGIASGKSTVSNPFKANGIPSWTLTSSLVLLAPYISSGIFSEILKPWMKGCKVIVLDVPLLFEAKMDKWTNPIIVVWVDPETQLQRLLTRDGTSEEDADL